MKKESSILNFENYEQVCKACDEILTDDCSNDTTKSMPWLYVIRWHPEYLKQYASLFKNKNNLNLRVKVFFKFVRFRLMSILYIVKSLFINNKKFKYEKVLQADLLLISHFVSINNTEDFYFGNLEDELNNHGIKSIFTK